MVAVRRVRHNVVVAVLAASVALAGCSSDGATSAPAATTPTTSKANESAFCATFVSLSEQRGGRDGDARNKDEAAWDRSIETVERIAAAAPDEIKTQADVYVQMVNDRKELAAANGWADVSELPADARSAFIRDHAAMQQQVNELIAFAKANCPGMQD